MLKRSFALALALLMALAIVGCGPSEPATPTPTPPQETPDDAGTAPREPVELTFYFPTQVGGALALGMEELVNEFNAQSDYITVTPVYTGSYKQTAQKAMTDIGAGQGPNVVLSGMLDIVDYYNIDAVKDITSLIEAEGADWRSDFIEGFWGNFNMADGGVYGLPFQHSVCVLFYNNDMLQAAGIEKAPSNWEEMLSAVTTLHAHNNKVVPLEFPADVWVLENIALSNSSSLIASASETTLEAAGVVASLDYLAQLVKAGAMVNANYAEGGEDFVAESTAMTINTTGNLGFIAADATFDWGVTTVPINTTPGLSYGGGGMIMMDGQSEAEEAASWEFMKYMTSPEISAKWMTISGYFAVRKSCEDLQIAQDYYAANPQLAQAKELLQYTTAQWFTDSYWDVYAEMTNAMDKTLISGDVSAADALAAAQAAATAILAK